MGQLIKSWANKRQAITCCSLSQWSLCIICLPLTSALLLSELEIFSCWSSPYFFSYHYTCCLCILYYENFVGNRNRSWIVDNLNSIIHIIIDNIWRLQGLTNHKNQHSTVPFIFLTWLFVRNFSELCSLKTTVMLISSKNL